MDNTIDIISNKPKRGRPAKKLSIQNQPVNKVINKSIGCVNIQSLNINNNQNNFIQQPKIFIVRLLLTHDDIIKYEKNNSHEKNSHEKNSHEKNSHEKNSHEKNSHEKNSHEKNSYEKNSYVPIPISESKHIEPEFQHLYETKYIYISKSNIPINFLDSLNIKKIDTEDILKQRLPEDLCLCDKTGGKWPQVSQYCCMNCELEFPGSPIGIPDKFISGKFYCYNNFCWFPCAFRYLYDHEYHSTHYWYKVNLLNSMYNIYLHKSNVSNVSNVSNEPNEFKLIIMAPSRILKQKYGGFLSDDDFRKCINNKLNYDTYTMPLIPLNVHINNMNKPITPSSIQCTDPLKTNEHTRQSDDDTYISIDKTLLENARKNVKEFLHKSCKPQLNKRL